MSRVWMPIANIQCALTIISATLKLLLQFECKNGFTMDGEVRIRDFDLNFISS